jgi:hypothetical protein
MLHVLSLARWASGLFTDIVLATVSRGREGYMKGICYWGVCTR